MTKAIMTKAFQTLYLFTLYLLPFTLSKIKDQGSRVKDPGSRIKDQGPRIKDHGPCFGTNEHPRRDTDVILRLSKSTIEDLSFYIGFTFTRTREDLFFGGIFRVRPVGN